MKKLFQKFLIAGSHNNFKPNLLTEGVALGVIALFIGLLSLIHGGSNIAFKNGMLADVYPAIVTSLANDGRKEAQIPELTYNLALEKAATMKVQDMIAKNYFSHAGPDGKQPWDWIDESGYYYQYAGENLAINYTDSIDVHRAWMNSPTHRANIMNKNFNEIGVAVATTTIDGRLSTLVVEMFGRQMPASKRAGQDIAKIPLFKSTSTSTATSSVKVSITPTTSENVLGASSDYESFAETSVPNEEKTNISQSEMLALGVFSNPNAVSMGMYILFLILISFAAMALGFVEYHKHHKKSIFIAVLIFISLTIVTIIFIGLKPEVVII